MWKKRKQLFTVSLMLSALNCLFSCAPVSFEHICPVYPIAGEKVAVELEKAGDLPATWEWIGRLNKLRQELNLCQSFE